MPAKAHGVCAVVAVTNACESVQFMTVAQFIQVIAIQRGLKTEDEIKLFQ
jgi:hypothetical protein